MSYADIEERKQQLIRKALKGSVFIADIAADPITALTTGATADLSPLPTGYSDLGWLTEEGMPFGRDVGQSNVTSFGSQTPTRSDVTSDVTTLTVIPQETKGVTIGLYTGADMAAIEAAVTTGETWIEGEPKGATSLRRVDFRNSAGRVIVSAATTWAMLDRATNRLVRVRPSVLAPFRSPET